MISQATYIWIDGSQPSQTLRSKVKILHNPHGEITLRDFPEWNFDGSSTYQSTGGDSDLLLQPVCYVNDPLLPGDNYLVLCEVMSPDGKPHPTNKRAKLRTLMEKFGNKHEPWLGFEQEYTLFRGQQPLGWPDRAIQHRKGLFIAEWERMKCLAAIWLKNTPRPALMRAL